MLSACSLQLAAFTLFPAFTDLNMSLTGLHLFISNSAIIFGEMRSTFKIGSTMMRILSGVALLLLMTYSGNTFGQRTDTVSFFSEVFKAKRSIYVHTPEFARYRSDTTSLPVIYLLDGQHDWFTGPVLSEIRYLQYTHEIPNAIIVVIPHQDRIKECAIRDISKDQALDSFIIREVEIRIKPYHPNAFRLIIGHSFSASFSLFAYGRHPDFFSAVIANSPLDKMEELVSRTDKDDRVDKNGICISVGGLARDKDYFHRVEYDSLKLKYPPFFSSIHTFEADHSYHNAVPIVATPALLTEVFATFKSRYTNIAPVNENYQMAAKPLDPEAEYSKMMEASRLNKYFYAPEIPDINGIASRFSSNGYPAQAIKIYETGTRFYPYYYGFWMSLYDLLKETEKQKARACLVKAQQLLQTREPKNEENRELLKEIRKELGNK